jgi:hypothetical protein
MKTTTLLPLASLFLAPLVSSAVVIDDFGTPGLSEYTLTRVLDNGFAESNISFSDSSGSLVASYTTGGTPLNQAEQVFFLRNDYSLSVGQTLKVDVSFAAQTSQMDFGIAVANAAPTSVSIGDTDTRDLFKWAAVYVRPSQDAVRSGSYDAALDTGTGVLSAVETAVTGLYITRVSASTFDLGYFNASNSPILSKTVTFGSSSSVGTLIGFYGDLRASGGTLGSLDNLQIIPEPSSCAMLAGLLTLGVATLGRRRRA